MSKIVELNNITKIKIPADKILEKALGELKYAIVIGYDKNGIEYFNSSFPDGGDVLWLLERMKKKLLSVVDN